MAETILENPKIKEQINTAINEDKDRFLKTLEIFIKEYKKEKKENLKKAIPSSLFSNRNMGSLEIISKYLKENQSLTYAQISKITNRNPRTIWTSYNNAKNKRKQRFNIKNEKYQIPCEIFSQRSQGPLEAIVIYLKDEKKLSFKEISKILKREYSTIWISYKNGKRKTNR